MCQVVDLFGEFKMIIIYLVRKHHCEANIFQFTYQLGTSNLNFEIIRHENFDMQNIIHKYILSS